MTADFFVLWRERAVFPEEILDKPGRWSYEKKEDFSGILSCIIRAPD